MIEFKSSSEVEDDITIIHCSGRFDAHTVNEVKAEIDAATGKYPAKVLVDLSGTIFIDSSALSTLVHGMKDARLNDGDLVLYGLQQSVLIIFELTRLDKAFVIVDDKAAGKLALA